MSRDDENEAGENDVVFGIRKSKELMEKYPRTMEYFNMCFEHHMNTTQEKPTLLAMVVKAKKWKPPARFFQYSHGDFHVIDDNKAKEKTKEVLRGMKQTHERQSEKAVPTTSPNKPRSPKTSTKEQPKKTAKLVSNPKNFVLFGVGSNKTKLENYPRTKEYRELLHRNFEAHLKVTGEKRVEFLKSLISQAHNWDPPAEFFKLDKGNGELFPLDEKLVLKETQKIFGTLRQDHKRRELQKLEGTVEGLEENDEISIAPTATSEMEESKDGGGFSTGNRNSTQSEQSAETHSRDKKRRFTEIASDIDLMEYEMKDWDPSSIRYKLRTKFLARTNFIKL